MIVSFKTGQDGGSCQQLRIYRGNREADMQTIISSAIDVQWSKMTADEMIAHMFGPIDGRRNEASMLRESHVE